MYYDSNCIRHNETSVVKFKSKKKSDVNPKKENGPEFHSETKDMQSKVDEMKKRLFVKKVKKSK